jgi:hypothetical protein
MRKLEEGCCVGDPTAAVLPVRAAGVMEGRRSQNPFVDVFFLLFFYCCWKR